MGSVTGSSSKPELAGALHRLRSTLARLKAELELADSGGDPALVDHMLADLREALELLGEVESAALNVVRVLVVDDDERLGELTARGLRRLGYDAESSTVIRPLRSGEVMVFDLSLVSSLDEDELASLKSARPIVVTGAADIASRALASDYDASDYLVKPVELEELASAISRRTAEARP